MGKEFDQIDSSIRTWIEKQKLFFVATAPSSADGLVNLSPKGMDSFRVLGPNTIAYLDLTGSGIETIAHLKDNPRITVMMCAFEGPPKIFRFYGRGEAFLAGSDRYKELLPKFGQLPGARSIIHIELDRIIDSCGYSIPLYEHAGDRDVLSKWADAKGEQGVRDYQQEKNRTSLDGLEGMP
ncbi:MAG: hypothetical protein ACI8XO_002168 [Verrucomicrobiales bacterium]|jgi:hypothetical protein